MKKISLLITFTGVFLYSCNNWLDVNPRTQTKKEVLLSTQKGFRDVLTGAYIRLKNTNLYGGEMTWGAIEYLAQHWTTTTGHTDNYIQMYDYTNSTVKDRFSSIFKTFYQVIADVNGLLENIDTQKDVFTEGNYELIKGEALAIRAFCHLDVLRLWGPMPKGEISQEKILPYVKTVTNEIHDYFTYEQFVKLLFDDLDEAERLLEQVDPILVYSVEELKDETTCEVEDDFWTFRQVRMNYYAVLALKARLYLWINDLPNAALYANKVINAMDHSGAKMWKLADGVTMESGDLACASEAIISLSVYDLDEKATNNFDLTGGGKYVDYIFPFYIFPSAESVADIRANKQWVKTAKNGAEIYICQKYYQPENNALNEIPLIRLTEMFFIAMEATESSSDADKLYAEYATTRGVSNTGLGDNRTDVLTKEFNKEFYAEGQMFFFYKRIGASQSLEYKTIKPEAYVLPLPEREISFNNN